MKVLSPNGGASYQFGKNIEYQYSIKTTDTQSEKISVSIKDIVNNREYDAFSSMGGVEKEVSPVLSYTLNPDIIPAGTAYKLHVVYENLTTRTKVEDYSDATFTISSAPGTPIGPTVYILNPFASGYAVNNQSGRATAYALNYQFTFTNNSTENLFVSKKLSEFLSTSSAGSTYGAATSSSITVTGLVVPDTYAGDTTSAYAIPAGTSRTFYLSGTLRPTVPGAAQYSELKITGVKYGTTAANPTTKTLIDNLGALKVGFNF